MTSSSNGYRKDEMYTRDTNNTPSRPAWLEQKNTNWLSNSNQVTWPVHVQGFTLLELIIVMVLISLTASVAVPKIQ
ncbi:MAG: type II secretion system protein, partial [Candidatus Electrothrix sp. ATG1]|nr:type II secretion system protein [Candidatus Electrothrix sp. ATG1]